MTKKDHQLVAEALGAAYKANTRLDVTIQEPKYHLQQQAARHGLLVATTAALGARFKADNSGFKRALFSKAVRDAAGLQGSW